MKRSLNSFSAALVVALTAGNAYARDLGVLVLPIHEGKLTSSLVYERLKLEDDFDSRGRAEFTGDIAGAVFSYGLTDRVAVAVKGGTIVNPHVEAQGSTWESRAGYLYGMDLYNEVFPVTELRPGVQLSGGVTGFNVPLDRTDVGGTGMIPVDQEMTGVEYHGAVMGAWKVSRIEPYAGVRVFGSSVRWQDNQSNPGVIKGHAHGNISLVVGMPVKLAKDVRFLVEGRFLNETAITAGFTIAAF